MGADALNGNGITQKLYYLIRDRKFIAPSEPLGRVRKSRIVLFVALQLVGFGATFAITQTIGELSSSWRCERMLKGIPCSCDRIPGDHHALHTIAGAGCTTATVHGGGAGDIGRADGVAFRMSPFASR